MPSKYRFRPDLSYLEAGPVWGGPGILWLLEEHEGQGNLRTLYAELGQFVSLVLNISNWLQLKKSTMLADVLNEKAVKNSTTTQNFKNLNALMMILATEGTNAIVISSVIALFTHAKKQHFYILSTQIP